MAIEGETYWYFETGTEGFRWVLRPDKHKPEDGPVPRDKFYYLSNGDHLVVKTQDGSDTIFSGVVEFTTDPLYPEEYGWACRLRRRPVVDPDDFVWDRKEWRDINGHISHFAELFLDEHPGVVTRHEQT